VPKEPAPVATPSEPSVIDAGPTHRILTRCGLVHPERRVVLRAALAVAVSWVPIVVMALAAGAFATLLRDIEVHAKLLLALPMAILAEIPADRWSRRAVRQFHAAGLVGPEAESDWQAAVREFRRILDAPWGELLIFAAVAFVAWSAISRGPISDLHPWQHAAGNGLTAAGWWYVVVARPIYQFVMLRWLWKLLTWSRLLFRASKMDLSLQPAHPDRAAGLGFVGLTHGAFAPLVFAVMTGSAGMLANLVLAGQVDLPALKWLMPTLLLVILLIFIGPLFVFMPQLIQLKREGQYNYGALAARYAREFDAKWIRGQAAPDESLVGSADIQSMADMGGTLEPVVGMRILPIDFATIRLLVGAAALPLLPVLCLKVPVSELLQRVFGLLL